MATHFYFDGHTYEIEPAPLSWDAANTNAVTNLAWSDPNRFSPAVTSSLAKIDSAAENAAILQNLKQSISLTEGSKSGTDSIYQATTAVDGGGASYVWIGGSDEGKEGIWTWSDGSALTDGYQNWGSGIVAGIGGPEPDNFNGNQNFLAIATGSWPSTGSGSIGSAGQWNDLTGSDQLLSLVEWDGLIGTDGADRLNGTSRDDVIDGKQGADKIKAGAGNDIVYMGQGDDIVDLGDGDNFLTADTGDTDDNDGKDSIVAKGGNDFIGSGVGDDIIKAGNGENFIIGGEGNDQITTGSGDDLIDFNFFPFYPATGARVTTQDFRDALDAHTVPAGTTGYYKDGSSGDGNDTIKAGAGNDVIFLGKGNDKVWGGAGSDYFVFSDASGVATSTSTSSSSESSSGSTSSANSGFVVGAPASGSTGAGGGTSMPGTGSGSSSSSSTAAVHTIYDFNISQGDKIFFDVANFEALAAGITDAGLSETNFIKGRGFNAPSSNETGIDDFLILDTGSGKLYYDADGSGTEENTVLIATLRGKLTDFSLANIGFFTSDS